MSVLAGYNDAVAHLNGGWPVGVHLPVFVVVTLKLQLQVRPAEGDIAQSLGLGWVGLSNIPHLFSSSGVFLGKPGRCGQRCCSANFPVNLHDDSESCCFISQGNRSDLRAVQLYKEATCVLITGDSFCVLAQRREQLISWHFGHESTKQKLTIVCPKFYS